jgi:hypothetical protein
MAVPDGAELKQWRYRPDTTAPHLGGCIEHAAARYPGFLVYQARSHDRPIPVIRLVPATEALDGPEATSGPR